MSGFFWPWKGVGVSILVSGKAWVSLFCSISILVFVERRGCLYSCPYSCLVGVSILALVSLFLSPILAILAIYSCLRGSSLSNSLQQAT